ncbi:GTP-dependent dephospho-CoA kinase family protein [Methanococcus aeolicus]|uniref:GTP-dependent dephospho-CoA kinase n=1 Tax=Methanococcus aeolicus (strain ATCC BAA-1280 / DSM 17508 / OCM 812 / Nankai-3) TaxID=419665 RepID=DPCKG_META3|nr:DUF359 domain-containing protein [Methanococcus aeolicus]A6UTP9.1 RecName: Full=GTP-dependent dephospho-CoA kinase; AltName: Full=Dephospho-coenzyme A kinase; Short=DPCK [Methanococcus aeolicus Nankai-3]ABR55871.1 Protein of unknown function DUF359 [Methanococcus aeolicus Nankai-3]UXM84024.1 DUF359 domain-containing protein [Methanococcus aeolicus]
MYMLNESTKEILKKPFGKVYKELPPINRKVNIIAVGDITTKNLLSKSIIPNLSIIDLKTKRNIPVKINHKFKTVFEVNNPQGCISDEAEETIKYISSLDMVDTALIVKDGEEDLLTMMVIRYFPKDTIVLYGQPDEGVVLLTINQDLKHKINNILSMMDKI